jgi:hypothetical protein
MYSFIFLIRHDKGTFKLKTSANTEEQAIQKIVNFEHCPEFCISLHKKIKLF